MKSIKEKIVYKKPHRALQFKCLTKKSAVTTELQQLSQCHAQVKFNNCSHNSLFALCLV